MRIGILAFGSLIGDPGNEIATLEIRGERRKGIETPFPVEFARSSQKRAGAPSIVPFEAGGRVNAEIIVVEANAKAAKDALWRREINEPSNTRGYRDTSSPGVNTLVIREFREMEGLTLVLAACFRQNIPIVSAERLASLAIQSASDKDLEAGRDGITYLIKAKASGIVTPLSPAYEAEILRLTGAPSLEAARAKLRAA